MDGAEAASWERNGCEVGVLVGGGKLVVMVCHGVGIETVAEGMTGASFVSGADEGRREQRSGYRKGNEVLMVELSQSQLGASRVCAWLNIGESGEEWGWCMSVCVTGVGTARAFRK